MIENLVIGVKRRLSKISAKEADRLNTEFKTERNKTLKQADYRCYRCNLRSKSNGIHHIDDNHSNNAPENLAVVCSLCAPYSHVGEEAKPVVLEAEKYGRIPMKATALVRVPREVEDLITPENLHHLMRAIGVALGDEKEAPVAKKIYSMLIGTEQVREFAQAIYGEETGITSIHPSDVAAGMEYLTTDEYNQRARFISDVRVLYHPGYLKKIGGDIQAEQVGLQDPKKWSITLQGSINKVKENLFAELEQEEDSDN